MDNQSPGSQTITFVLQYFHPEFASTAQLMTELCESLVKKGMNVNVVTGQPSYSVGKKLPKKEVYNGIKIRRLPSTQFDKNKALGRILNWATFTVFSFFYLLFSKKRNKLFIVSQPPFLFVVGWLLNLLRDQDYYCLVYDLYPDIAVSLGMIKKDRFIDRSWNRANISFFKRAEYVIVPSNNMRMLIADKMGEGRKIKVINNWSDGESIKPLNKSDNWFCEQHKIVDKIVVLYSGNIGLFHSLEVLVDAAEVLKNQDLIQFVFIGEGGKKNKLMRMANEKGLSNVLFLPYQEKEVLPYSLTCADFSVVSLEKSLDCVAAPCKLYSALAAGTAILGITDPSSEVAHFVEEYKCGINVEHKGASDIVDFLCKIVQNRALLDDMKANSRRCFEENFRRQVAVDKYYELLNCEL